MCITNPLKISDFQGNLLHMLLFSQKCAFYFSILRIKKGLSHVQQPHSYAFLASPSGKMILFTKKKITIEMPPFRTVVPML